MYSEKMKKKCNKHGSITCLSIALELFTNIIEDFYKNSVVLIREEI